MVEFRQWILVGFIIVFAVAEGIQRQADGVAEGGCVGLVAARDAVARSGVGGGVHEWQTGCKEHAILGVERMERGSGLIMIHGHDAVELYEISVAEELVGWVRTEGLYFLLGKLVNGWDDDFSFLRSAALLAVVARVQGEHGDARVGNHEVALQGCVHLLHLLDDEFLGDGCRHVLERSFSGY